MLIQAVCGVLQVPQITHLYILSNIILGIFVLIYGTMSKRKGFSFFMNEIGVISCFSCGIVIKLFFYI